MESRSKEVDSDQDSVEPNAAVKIPTSAFQDLSIPETSGKRFDTECLMGVVTNKDEYFRKHSRNARGRAQIISKKTSACSVEERGREIDPGKHAQIGAAYDSMILVEWLGPVVSASHDRLHSSVCSVGGVTIRVQDTAFFRSKSLDVAPYIARIQALWEDQGSGQKWVRVNWCYYPSDLPVNMCRPVISDPREVYESNHCDNNLVGSIQGPCLVLPPLQFQEEVERRSKITVEESYLPLFLCQ